jgi:hypothetical protein
MPNQGPPPPNEDILTAFLRHQQEATTGTITQQRIKEESEIGSGSEIEKTIDQTQVGPQVRTVYSKAKFGCGCLKPESEMGAKCQHRKTRKKRCERIICKECARERVCFDCGIRVCEDHGIRVPNHNGNPFYFCVRCAGKRKGRNFLKSFFEFILAPFIVRERIR